MNYLSPKWNFFASPFKRVLKEKCLHKWNIMSNISYVGLLVGPDRFPLIHVRLYGNDTIFELLKKFILLPFGVVFHGRFKYVKVKAGRIFFYNFCLSLIFGLSLSLIKLLNFPERNVHNSLCP